MSILVRTALFFNHFAATNVTGFSETLSLAENFLSLARKSLSLEDKIIEFLAKSLGFRFVKSI